MPIIFPIRKSVLAVFVCGDFDHRWSQQAVSDSITAGEFFNHCFRFVFIGGFGNHRLVHVRIEAFTYGGDWFDAEGFRLPSFLITIPGRNDETLRLAVSQSARRPGARKIIANGHSFSRRRANR